MAHTAELVVGAALAAAAVAATAVVAIRVPWPDPAPPSPAVMPRAVDDEPTPAAASAPVSGAAADANSRTRQAVPPTEPWLEHPFELEISVLVVDANGLPMDGEAVRAAAPNTRLHEVGRTNADGRLSLRWRSRTPTADVVLADPHWLLHRVTVSHERTASVVFVGEEKTIGSYTVRGDRRRSVVWRSATLHPFAWFAADVASVPSLPETSLDATSTFLMIDWFGDENWLFGPEARYVTGVVLLADGSPAANERVALLDGNGRTENRTYTRDDGRFTFAVPGATVRTMRIGGGENGIAVASIAPTEEGEPVRIVLDRGAVLRGHVTTHSDDQSTRLRVEWHPADGSWCDETITDADGNFAFANVVAATGDVFAFEPDCGLPVAWSKRVPTSRVVSLRGPGADSCLVVRSPAQPVNANEIEVRAWQLDTGHGTALWRGENGCWTSGHLAAGWYAVEAIVRGAGVVDLGRHWLDGSRVVAIGPFEPPAPARVRFVSATPLPGAELFQVRDDFDARVALDEVPLGHEVLLPAGCYALAVRDHDGSARFVRFRARAGEATVVTAPQ